MTQRAAEFRPRTFQHNKSRFGSFIYITKFHVVSLSCCGRGAFFRCSRSADFGSNTNKQWQQGGSILQHAATFLRKHKCEA